jgi:hypothetical protein
VLLMFLLVKFLHRNTFGSQSLSELLCLFWKSAPEIH